MNEVVTRQQLEQQAARIPGASQATGIEQSRAIAEVQAAVAVAQRFPRNEGQALNAVIEACGQRALAERAFYSFPRGGESVNGPSIALAVELARCWGNIDYGIMELERDDVAGHTEMLAFAWDLQTNTKSRQTFIVPHSRDTRSGRKMLTDMRDIYENNANNGARRLRECIFRVMPVYIREAAERECRKVLEKGEGNMPMPERISRAIRSFADIGVSLERLELRQGKSTAWTPVDLANLHILHTSIRNGETTIDEAFPKEGVGDTADRVRELAKPKAKAEVKPTEQVQDAEVEEIGEPKPLYDRMLDGVAERQAAEAQQTVDDIDGPLDADQPEEQGPDPREATADRIIADIAKCATVIDLQQLRTREGLTVDALPDELGARVKEAYAAREAALKGEA